MHVFFPAWRWKPAVLAPTAALLGHPRLELCGMDVRPALRFSLRPPVMMLRLLCRYEDQLGAPVYYEQNTEDITCTDSSGNVLKISHVCSESEKSQRPFHGDPVRICMAFSGSGFFCRVGAPAGKPALRLWRRDRGAGPGDVFPGERGGEGTGSASRILLEKR